MPSQDLASSRGSSPRPEASACGPDSPQTGRSRSLLMAALKYGLAFALLAGLYYFKLIDLKPLAVLLKHPWAMLGMTLLAWLTLPLMAWRWWLLLSSQGVKPNF